MPKQEIKIAYWHPRTAQHSGAEKFEPGDVIKEFTGGGEWVVEREVPYSEADLPMEEGSIVMVKTGGFPYVWVRYEFGGNKVWAQAGTSITQTSEQIINEANKLGNLTTVYRPGA